MLLILSWNISILKPLKPLKKMINMNYHWGTREHVFSQIKKKSLECSETKEYAKIFCELFAGMSVENMDIFFSSKYLLEILKY